MRLKPKDNFRLKQDTIDSIFNGLELVVQNNGPNIVIVEAVDNSIVITVEDIETKLFN
jgi:hypothetical protein